MKRLTTTLISLTLLFSSVLYAGEVYRVIDEDGQITFTDSPAASSGAETVNLPITNISVAPSLPSTDEAEGDIPEDEARYTSARITQPRNNATIPPGQSQISVQLALKPALQTGHRVQLYVDGRPQGAPVAASAFSISKLSRGAHKIGAEIIGADKKRRAKTQTVTVHVKQHSAKH